MSYKNPKDPRWIKLKKQWVVTHKEHRRLYALRVRTQKRNERPIPFCACGNKTQFRWTRGWVCVPCSQKQSQLKKRERQISRALVKVSKHGERAIQAYLQYSRTHKKVVRATPVFIHNLCLPYKYQALSEDKKYRIYTLNQLTNSPFGNIGWSCQICRAYSAEPLFFDLDHKHPKHKGGISKRENLQVLCPNCHRRKTILDVYGLTDISHELPTVTYCQATITSTPAPVRPPASLQHRGLPELDKNTLQVGSISRTPTTAQNSL